MRRSPFRVEWVMHFPRREDSRLAACSRVSFVDFKRISWKREIPAMVLLECVREFCLQVVAKYGKGSVGRFGTMKLSLLS
jgi:hypothetical protein